MTTRDVQVSVDLAKLRKELTDFFSLEDLRTLCFDLGVDYESLPGEGKAAKVRELIAECEREGRILGVLEAYYRARPSRRPNIVDRVAPQSKRTGWAMASGLFLLGVLLSLVFLSPLSPISLIKREPIPVASLVGFRYVTDNFDPRSADLRTVSTHGIPVYHDEALRIFDLAVLAPEVVLKEYQVGIEVYASGKRIGAAETRPMKAGLIQWDEVSVENYIHGNYSHPAHWDIQPEWGELEIVVATYDGAKVVASTQVPVRLDPKGDAWFLGPPNLYIVSVVYSVNGGVPSMIDLRTATQTGLGVEPGDILTIEEVWYKANSRGSEHTVQVEAYLSADGFFDHETFRPTPPHIVQEGIQQLSDVSNLTWIIPESRDSLVLWLTRSDVGRGIVMDNWEIPLRVEETS